MKSRTTLVLFFTLILDFIGVGVIIPLLPDFSTSLNATPFMLGVIVGGYALMQFVFSPLLGTLSDRYGRRPVLLASIAINGLGFILFGWADSLALLILARLISGAASANRIVAQACLSDLYTAEERFKTFGIISAAVGIGFTMGPPLGTLVYNQYGGQGVGIMLAISCLVNFVIAFIWLPESLNIEQRQLKGDELKVKDILRDPALMTLFLVNLIFTAASSTAQAFGGLLWANQYQFSVTKIGIMLTFVGIVTALTPLLINRVGVKIAPLTYLMIGLCMVGLGLALMPFVPMNTILQGLVPLVGIHAIGHAIVMQMGIALVSQRVAANQQGQIMGYYQALASLALAFGPVLAGILFQFKMSAPFLLSALACAFALLMAFRARNRFSANLS